MCHPRLRAGPVRASAVERDGRPVPRVYRVATDPPVIFENPFAERPLRWAPDWRDSYDEIARAGQPAGLHEAIVAGKGPPYGWENARQDQELNVACRESGRRGGAPLPLPLRGITG